MKQIIENEGGRIDEILQQLGPVIRQTMVGAIGIIQHEASTFVAQKKEHYDGHREDVVTTADRAAQEHYVVAFTAAFPELGLLGEEDGLNKACTLDGEDIYITIDPLDGTKAFARKQSFGVGTMVAVVRNDEVIAAYIGDVNTGEIYGFAPSEPTPTRTRFGVQEPLRPDLETPLAQTYALINLAPHRLPELVQTLVRRPNEGGLFKDIHVFGGSFGIWCTRLWKGEVTALLLDPAYETPWDRTPVIGFHKALGFRTLNVGNDGAVYTDDEFKPRRDVHEDPFFRLVVHESRVQEILNWFAKAKK